MRNLHKRDDFAGVERLMMRAYISKGNCASHKTLNYEEKNMTTIAREALFNTPASRSSGLLGRIRTFLARSRAEQQLAQLDDRLLADIGLKRSEITRMVWGN